MQGYADLDSFAPHALEALGCMVERRRGGESGVVAVQYATRRKLLVRSSLEMHISG